MEEKELFETLNSNILSHSEKWFGHSSVEFVAKNAFELEILNDYASYVSDGLFICFPVENKLTLLKEIVKTSVVSEDLEHAITSRVLHDFLSDFSSNFPGVQEVNTLESKLPKNLHSYGSGWIAVDIVLHKEFLFRCYLAEDVVKKLTGNPREFFPNNSSFGSFSSLFKGLELEFSAGVGMIRLGLQQLKDLEVGDVVKTDVKINEEVNLISSNNQLYIRGYICERNSCRSVLISGLSEA
ncbi:FliM/FliN family flagellar motor switch protein [Microbulbifer sp. GL-2]|uniref:FliM/FliN family flagellar motor switch protein n=1 Tax=Microbulbifer sp. GL-2 TaxID=2591606 RepID=UPI00155A37DB|nr:FliM/FliN family flagellar motor switch protein [Microbulbifer sp. GL-2]